MAVLDPKAEIFKLGDWMALDVSSYGGNESRQPVG